MGLRPTPLNIYRSEVVDAWVANLNSGITVVEKWVPDQPPPWGRLVALCKENSTWVTNLRMTICSKTVSLPSHAEGYWHICRPMVIEGVSTENLPVVRGIGHVEKDMLHVLWGARTQTNEAYFYSEQRLILDKEENIIWSPGRK